MDFSDVGRRLEEERRRKGVQQKWLAAQIGVKPQVLNRILKGRVKKPSFSIIAKAAAILGVSLDDWLGSGAKLADEIRDAPMTGADRFMPFEIPPEEFIEIDYDYMQTYRGGPAEIRDGAAAGQFEEIDTTGETAELLNPTLRDIQSGRYGVVKVKGESMEPRLHDGDLVLIDTFDKTPGPKRIMAVHRRKNGVDRGGSALGIIHEVAGTRILTKVNSSYPPIILTERDIIRGVVKKRLAEDLE